MKRRQEGMGKAIAHYLAELDEADRCEPEVREVKVTAIKERLEKLDEEMAKLKVYEKELAGIAGQAALPDRPGLTGDEDPRLSGGGLQRTNGGGHDESFNRRPRRGERVYRP